MILDNELQQFSEYLRREERSENTVSKYLHDVGQFFVWLDGRDLTKETVTAWKEHLSQLGRAVVTVNSALAALHSFLEYCGKRECRVKYLKRQQMFQSMSRVGRCIDNGPMEGFWGILKSEMYYLKKFTDEQDLIDAIEQYIHFYNTRRYQKRLRCMTPMEFHAAA